MLHFVIQVPAGNPLHLSAEFFSCYPWMVINDKTAELLDMPRQTIEIKGTLLEHEGQKTLSIIDISPVTP